jgi:galactoside O-acetyltransferase
MLNGNLSYGSDTQLNFTLTVRDAVDCSLEIGSQSEIHGSICLERRSANVQIGSRTYIGGLTLIDSAHHIEIGDDVMISFECIIMDNNSHSVNYHERENDVLNWRRGVKDWTPIPMAPVVIHNKAWIGARAIILKGVTVGEGAVVGAGSLVTKDVPAWTVVAGNPAKVIRTGLEKGKQD